MHTDNSVWRNKNFAAHVTSMSHGSVCRCYIMEWTTLGHTLLLQTHSNVTSPMAPGVHTTTYTLFPTRFGWKVHERLIECWKATIILNTEIQKSITRQLMFGTVTWCCPKMWPVNDHIPCMAIRMGKWQSHFKMDTRWKGWQELSLPIVYFHKWMAILQICVADGHLPVTCLAQHLQPIFLC